MGGKAWWTGMVAASVVTAAAFGSGGCKKSARPPEKGAAVEEREDAGAGRGGPPRVVELPDGAMAAVIEPSGDASLLHPPAELAPARAEFLCPGKEEFEPTKPDPQPGFTMDDIFALFPDMPHDKVPIDVRTEGGNLKCEVWPGTAPRAAAIFLGLATGARAWWHPCRHEWVRGEPYYDETSFHAVVPTEKLEAGCLYRGCEAAAGFATDVAEPGAPFDKPGLLIMPRHGGAGIFAILDCAWKVPEPTKMMEGTCEFQPAARALSSDWVAFGECKHDGLMSPIYQLARVAPDRHLDPHAIHWLRAVGPSTEYYRWRPEGAAGDGGEGGD
ncbi:MAG: hypothetical protein HY907_11805 [Deltaproteobacteria bacterium]|nr:hypothetical protein [Deltaproteobacteria bacterium]